MSLPEKPECLLHRSARVVNLTASTTTPASTQHHHNRVRAELWAWLQLAYHWISMLHNTGVFWALTTLGSQTNHIMLTYRTVAKDLGEPGCNQDWLAPKLRDALMPFRGWVHHTLPWLLHIYRWFLQSWLFGCPGIIDFVDVRTRWFDGKVQEAVESAEQQPLDGITQVVVVAAGFDTRAYRIGSRNVHFFEVDLPAASRAKQRLVQDLHLLPEGHQLPVYVAADLSHVNLEEALEGTGFDPHARTLFTLEGLLYYLPPEAAEQLLSSIARISAKGSRVVFDFLEDSVFNQQRVSCGYHSFRLTVQNKGEPLKSGLSPDPDTMSSLLRRCGWLGVQQLVTPRELAQALMPGRRWSSLSPPLPDFFHYCVAEKR